MAEIIPPLNKHTLSRMTGGEKRLARRFEALLEDDYLIWFDIPVGKQPRYPDFIVLHPARGLLFLEVKDWKPTTLKRISKSSVELLTNTGLVTKPHPLEQARQYTYEVIDILKRDHRLCESTGTYKGNLLMPYGYGVVFTNISRKQMEKAIPDDKRESLLPDHLMIYKDEIADKVEAEAFQERLWGMFHHQFGNTLTLPQIDRIRWHLFPEIRIDDGGQTDLFGDEDKDAPSIEQAIPDIVKIMDVQQEQLARSLGEGHRVIHGVAGSGKTLILGYRCLHLAQATGRPILVLCFNASLAAKLRAFVSSKGVGDQVQVCHFHDWCGQQLKTYHVKLPISGGPHYERQVEAVIDSVDKGQIPREQYGAVLIDEGHDFEAEWLKLVTQMVDSENSSLLLLYDDAQSIYKKGTGLGFSLSNVGIQARGRTTVLRLNYRNTREILGFAYSFASHYLDPRDTDDDEIPLLEPEAMGANGPVPLVQMFSRFEEEAEHAQACIQQWQREGVPWGDMAVLCTARYQGDQMAKLLQGTNVPHSWLRGAESKRNYDPGEDRVTVVTIHSSKGLEFSHVIVLGIGQLKDNEDRLRQDARLLYVGMTRAQRCLLMTASSENEHTRRLLTAAVA